VDIVGLGMTKIEGNVAGNGAANVRLENIYIKRNNNLTLQGYKMLNCIIEVSGGAYTLTLDNITAINCIFYIVTGATIVSNGGNKLVNCAGSVNLGTLQSTDIVLNYSMHSSLPIFY